MKIKKLIKVAAITGVLAVVMAMPAFAGRQFFEFDLYTEEGGDAHSNIKYKDDNDQNAYIYTTDGNIGSSDDVRIHLIGPYNETRYSNDKQIDSSSKRYVFPYTRSVQEGDGIRFYIKSYYLDAWVEGYWYS